MKFNPLLSLNIFFMIVFCMSCTDDLNFDNINLNVDPVFNGPIVYFKLTQNDFLEDDNSTEIPSITDLSDFEIFKPTNIRENTIEAVIDFEVANSFDRAFEIRVTFLDGDGNLVYSLPDLQIDEGNLNYTFSHSIIIQNSPTFVNSRTMSIEVHLMPSSNPIDASISETLEFRSIGTFYLSF
ncbi:MAG: Uncharacterised protein [Flavobacterium sp. SCGC AAA160-P02]|nr:MAG: Uncharacterised protein [Flavobacterium sp. SCGC AAA160-P02]